MRVIRRECIGIAFPELRGFTGVAARRLMMQIGVKHQRAEHVPVVARISQMQMPDLIDDLAWCHAAADTDRKEAELAVFVDRRARFVARPALLAREACGEVESVGG